MGIVAAEAIGFFKGLVLMGLFQCCIFWIVAVEAESGSRFGQMEIKLGLPNLTRLMRGVASVATAIQGSVTASVLSQILGADVMAGEAEVVFLIPRGGFEQLIGVVRLMRVMAFETVANRGGVHMAFDLRGVLIGVAG